jgi:hypothetical protein
MVEVVGASVYSPIHAKTPSGSVKITSLILIEPMIDEVHLPDNCGAYLIESTASTSVDGDIKAKKQKSAPVRTPPSESIQEIVDYIVAQRNTGGHLVRLSISKKAVITQRI